MSRRCPSSPFVLALAALALIARAEAGDLDGALLTIEAAPGTPGSEPFGSPPRFALLADGQVFAGGTSQLETTRLAKDELAALRKRIEAVRKTVERGGAPPAAPAGRSAVRVRFLEGRTIELLLDPLGLVPAASPLAALVGDLLRYDHPALVRYAPASYALLAQQRTLVGGCRRWTFGFPIEEALATPVAGHARDALGWPTGAQPASVCAGDKRFVVTLRPLLPGERP